MAFENEVLRVRALLSEPPVLHALSEVNSGIGRGYAQAGKEMQKAKFTPGLVRTAFPQSLYHHVTQQVCDIGGNDAEIVTDLRSNRRRSVDHVIVAVSNVLMTVSAVKTPQQKPRYAAHRSRYAMTQTYFKTPRSEPPDPLEAMPIPNPYDIGSLYIQVLHGPKSDDRQQHGFTVIRAMDMNDQYYPFCDPPRRTFRKSRSGRGWKRECGRAIQTHYSSLPQE